MPLPLMCAAAALYLLPPPELASAPAPIPAPAPAAAAASAGFHLEFVGSHATGLFNQSASEIAAYHPGSKRLFVLNGAVGLDILDISNPARPTKLKSFPHMGPNSVAVHGDLVAVAFAPPTDEVARTRGEVVFLNPDGGELGRITVGFLPDMVAFTPDGTKLIVANEGEPDQHNTIDPEGTVSIVDLSGGPAKATQKEATFGAFEPKRAQLEAAGVHLPVPGRSLAQQFEPEYVAVDSTGTRAFVTIQEANAVAVVDVVRGEVVSVVPLGMKDFSTCGLDASDKDGRIDIKAWPVLGLRQPDAIVMWVAGGESFFAIAEEGEARDTQGFGETERVGKLKLDPAAFPNADVAAPDKLGRLEVSKPACDTDGDGDADRLVAFGGRGVSIWKVQGDSARMVWDSGSAIERTVAERMPSAFNANSTENPSRDARSRTKGPEPEGLASTVIDGRRLLLAGLERTGGVMMWDVTDPLAPSLLDFVNRRNPDAKLPDALAAAGDLAPEGLLVIPADKSPDGTPLLVVCNETSGTTTIWRIARGPAPDVNPRRGL